MNRKQRRSGGQGPFPRTEFEQYLYDLAMFYADPLWDQPIKTPLWDFIKKEAEKVWKKPNSTLFSLTTPRNTSPSS